MSSLRVLPFLLTVALTAPAADFAPKLQWVAFPGINQAAVAGVGTDGNGNLYIIGATSSRSLPVTTGAQTPGGAPVSRIDLSSGATTKLPLPSLGTIRAAASSVSNPGVVYLASGSTVYRSADGLSSITQSADVASGVAIQALAVDPTNSSTVYAGTFTQGLFKSTDGGRTFTAINNGIPAQQNGAINIGRIWVEPSSPSVVFAAASTGLVRSADAGNTFAVVAVSTAFSYLSFDATPGTIYFADGGTLLYRSTDNGVTFVRSTPLPGLVGASALLGDPHHPGVVYAGAATGLFQSTDAGVTWTLKIAGVTTVLAADPNSTALYGNTSRYGIVKSTDGFSTTTAIGPAQPSIAQIFIAGANLFEISASTSDAFAVKLDSNGNVVYATYFGGSGSDTTNAVAVGPDGSVYLTGATTSIDLPGTAGTYLATSPATGGAAASYLAKLNPSGSLAWATYFTGGLSTPQSIAVDASGNPYVGGYSSGSHPTTPGAYQTSFTQVITSNGFFSVIGPTSAFVTKFNSQGTALVYSTYIPTDTGKNTVSSAAALILDSSGNAYVGTPLASALTITTTASIVKLNATGSALSGSAVQPGFGSVAALALDATGNVYAAGSYTPQTTAFPATTGAFQPAPQPVVPTLGRQSASGGGQEAFVAKFDASLTHLLAATLLGGESLEAANSLAIDSNGTVIVGGYTDSKAFPTHAPFQESFSPRSGFAAGFDPGLSNLLFSTYLGDTSPFAAHGIVPDGQGNLLLAGNTLLSDGGFIGGAAGAPLTTGDIVIANKVALPAPPSVRLDSVQNYASHLAAALAPGEAFTAVGTGFGPSAQILLDGSPLTNVSSSTTSLVAVVPDSAFQKGAHTLQISSAGALSNPMFVPAAAASPGIFSVDGSGAGQGYILNSDSTLNSPSNPAAPGSPITIFMTGAGPFTISNGFAVAAQMPAVFIDGFYCNGIAAIEGPVDGLPGNVYQLKVFVPDLAPLAAFNPGFTFPPQSAIQVVMGQPNSLNFANSAMLSQSGIFLNIK